LEKFVKLVSNKNYTEMRGQRNIKYNVYIVKSEVGLHFLMWDIFLPYLFISYYEICLQFHTTVFKLFFGSFIQEGNNLHNNAISSVTGRVKNRIVTEFIQVVHRNMGVRGGAVGYKPEGRGFDSR
jgi:hypothetical protein